MDETWRKEAYCQKHGAIEAIQKVKSSAVLSMVNQVYQAQVVLECGSMVTIVTTAQNLSFVGA